jgi:hypothetical protein
MFWSASVRPAAVMSWWETLFADDILCGVYDIEYDVKLYIWLCIRRACSNYAVSYIPWTSTPKQVLDICIVLAAVIVGNLD